MKGSRLLWRTSSMDWWKYMRRIIFIGIWNRIISYWIFQKIKRHFRQKLPTLVCRLSISWTSSTTRKILTRKWGLCSIWLLNKHLAKNMVRRLICGHVGSYCILWSRNNTLFIKKMTMKSHISKECVEIITLYKITWVI